MKFSTFATHLTELEHTSSRNELSEIFSKIIANCEDSVEVEEIVYLTLGRVAPKYKPIEFGFGEKQIAKVLLLYYKDILNDFEKTGDLGSSVLKLEKENLQQTVFGEVEVENSVCSVFEKLYNLATISGENSILAKSNILQELVVNLDADSLKWAIRIILGSLRIGLSDKSIIDSISIFLVGNKDLSETLEHAVGVRANIAEIAKLAFEIKTKNLNLDELTIYFTKLEVELYTPIAAKLVERVKDAEEIITRMRECYIQPKFDGLRIQAHVGKVEADAQSKKFKDNEKIWKVELYSRNMENTTSSYPDIVEALIKFAIQNDIKNAVFDGEVIGYDFENDKYLQFQQTVQRKRKNDITKFSLQIPVVYNVFDLIYLNSQDLTKVKIEDRLAKLNLFIFDQKSIRLAQTDFVSETEEISELFDNYVLDNGLEGIIAKQLSTSYSPGSRNFEWVKLKRSTDSSLNDFADLVVLGYYLGKGKRTSFGIGGILCGTYDKKIDKYLSVCKVGTGFSDEQFKTYKQDLDKLEIKFTDQQSSEQSLSNLELDQRLKEDLVLVEPKIVVEIEADEITKSELHSAGFSLRFPRIKQWNRDKDSTQTTTKEELERMFEIRKR